MNKQTHIGRWLDLSGRTAKSLASHMGVSEQWVSKLRNGHITPRKSDAIAIEKFTDGAVPITVWGYE